MSQTLQSPLSPKDDVQFPTVYAGSLPFSLSNEESLPGEIPLSGSMLIGRERDKVQIVLFHVNVSRIHAQITLQGNLAVVIDLKSSDGTFVNGQRIATPVIVQKGDRIDIGPYSLVFTGSALVPTPWQEDVKVMCGKLKRSVKDRRTGKLIQLLDDVG
jgi:pSer/pThr/pTyr-binding forkhead associated (FHA) protein